MNNSKLSSEAHNLETSTITNKFLEFLSVIKITNRMAFFMHLSLLQIDFAMHLTTSIKGFVMIRGNYRRENQINFGNTNVLDTGSNTNSIKFD